MGPNGNGAAQKRQKVEKVVIRFAGDSGDGMQLTGDRFTSEAALFGNDLATQPNYPAEIRAPAGTLPGVSSFQIQIADYDILTAGDRPDVLVAMNPAALKANLEDLPRGGTVIANSDEFTKRNLAKVGYVTNPLESGELSEYRVHAVPMTTLTLGAVEPIGASKKDGERSKNMFALGLLWGRELGLKANAPEKGVVDAVRVVGRQDDHAVKIFKPLKEIVDFQVGVAVGGRLHVGALGEQRIRFVKQQGDA